MGFIAYADHLALAGLGLLFVEVSVLGILIGITAMAVISAGLAEAAWWLFRRCGGRGGHQKVARLARWIAHKWLVADLKSKMVRDGP